MLPGVLKMLLIWNSYDVENKESCGKLKYPIVINGVGGCFVQKKGGDGTPPYRWVDSLIGDP